MKTKLRAHVAALMLLAPAAFSLVAEPAAAQQRAAAPAPTIHSMSVNSDSGLQPGAVLRFQLYGKANAKRADVVLGNSGVIVPLRQSTLGNYTGTYTVRARDRIDPTQVMAARLTHGQTTIARNFNFPPSFQALAMGAPSATSASVAIERFVMRPQGQLEPGRELRFRLRGAPGGDAYLDIPGVIRGVDMVEVRPGVYEGTYTIRRRDDLDAFGRTVATLRNGDQRATARLDMNFREDDEPRVGRSRDERPPQISDLFPGNGERISERGRTRISVRLSDEGGSGIDPASARLRLQGRDVTGDARVTDDELNFRAELEPGRYTAEVTVRDRAGNSSTKAWTFDVVNDGRDGRVGVGPLPLEITSHSNNAVVDGNGTLHIAGRTAPNATVRVQVESVASVAGLLGVTQPVADTTVQADRDGRFSVAVSPRGLPIPGTRYDVRLTASSGSQNAEERITLMQRQG